MQEALSRRMVFGLFKKSEKADMVFKGGKIYTLDPDMPLAEAVACKEGRITAIGDESSIEQLIGKNTNVVDLGGGVLFPGFIETCGHPVLQSFQSVCLILHSDLSQEGVLKSLSEYIKANPDKPAYFAYGFHTSFVANKPTEEMQKILDEVCDDKPVALLDISGFEGWFNTKATEYVKKTLAEEKEERDDDEEDGRRIITLSYVLHILSPIDFDKLRETVVFLAAEYCRRGYTTIFDCGAPDYLHAIYQDMVLEMLDADMIKQRFRGSLLVTGNVPSNYIIQKLIQKRTLCAEIDEYISCNVLKVIIDEECEKRDEEGEAYTCLLKTLAVEATDQGFDIHIDTVGEEAISKAFELTAIARASGSKKAHFTIAHTHDLTSDEKRELLLDSELCEAASTLGDFSKRCTCAECATDVKEAIYKLTVDAATELGVSNSFGSIEVGKKADFVIFKKDPMNDSLQSFLDLDAEMTVVAGRIVYDAKQDHPEEWHDALKSRQEQIEELLLDDEI